MTATLREDCGPCTPLVVRMAERAGVAPDTLRAVLQADDARMPDDVLVAVAFARAAMTHAPDADVARQDVTRRWGHPGVVSLAMAVVGSRLFPMMKYALGHGHTCQRVDVAGEIVPVKSGV